MPAHALHQGVHVALRDAVLDILDEDMVGVAGTTHELARNADIGVGYGYTDILLGSLAGAAQGLPHRFAVIHQTGRHSVGRLRNDGQYLEHSAFVRRSHGDHHLR